MSPDLALRLTRRVESRARVDGDLALTYEQRSRSRLRARLDDGREVGILLPRGEALSDGDLLGDERGEVIRVHAAVELVSCAEADDPLLLTRAAYHLGNRHVALQIDPGRLCWLHDHVLDAMVRGLGLRVSAVQAPFEPEAGAYGGASHGHDQGDVGLDQSQAHGHGEAGLGDGYRHRRG